MPDADRGTVRDALTRPRSSLALRIALGITLVTLLSLSLLAALLFVQIEARLEGRAETVLERSQALATDLHDRLGSGGFDEAADFYARLPSTDGLAVERLGRGDARLSGNAVGLGCAPGFRDVVLDTSSTIGEAAMVAVDVERYWTRPSLERFRVLSRRYGDQCLSFGRSLYELDTLIGNAWQMTYWAIPTCLLPSMLVGGLVARRTRRRLDGIGDALGRVADGDLSHRVSVTGIDEIDRLAVDANRSFARLQGSVQALEQMSSTVAHDLRAPLARLAIPLEAALAENRAGRADPASLESVSRGVDELREIFDALLRISQIESGRRRAAFRELDLRSLVADLAEIYAPVCEDAGMTLLAPQDPAGTLPVSGDRELLQQATVNVLENAIRYCPAGSTIRVATGRDDAGAVWLTVGDDGPGIPADERERVFGRLYRISVDGRAEPGTGLGLALVRAVGELHRATVTLHDAAPGLEVRMRFPEPAGRRA